MVASDNCMCPGSTQPLKNEFQETPGGKYGRCVRLTTYHLQVPMSQNLEALGPIHSYHTVALPRLRLMHAYNAVPRPRLCRGLERHGRGTAWERHGMCESAFNHPEPSEPHRFAMGMLYLFCSFLLEAESTPGP
jgi:hypothetical protein